VYSKAPLSIWVTGASSGIGREVAEQLAGEGHNVYASARNAESLASLVHSAKGNVTAIPCDVSDDRAMAEILSNYGIETLDSIFLCAGTCEYIDMPVLDIDMVRRVADTNYFGIVNSCIAALPLLRKSPNTTHIVGVGSMSSYLGFPRAEAYGASKAAMSYFLDSLRCDLVGEIDVTVVYPGFIKTPLTDKNDFPMPFLMTAEKAAEVILKKSSKRPLKISFPSRLHLLLQAMKVMPGLWYNTIAARMSRAQGAQQ